MLSALATPVTILERVPAPRMPRMPGLTRLRTAWARFCDRPVPGWLNFAAESLYRPWTATIRALLVLMKPAWPAWSLLGISSVTALSTVLFSAAAGASVAPQHHAITTAASYENASQQRQAQLQVVSADAMRLPGGATLGQVMAGVDAMGSPADIRKWPGEIAKWHAQQAAAAAAARAAMWPAALLAFQACVIGRESGGNPNVTNASGHYGLYQFSASTWATYGGAAAGTHPLSSAFGTADASAQNQVFHNAMATPGGQDNWRPYDGCVYYGGLVPSGVQLAAATVPAGGSMTMQAMNWALSQQGKPYIWGATGPGGYDCSGLVYAAYQHLGITIPRDTYEMLASVGSVLIPISTPVRGALAFYGTGHVELWWAPGVTFGAQQPGTLVGFHTYGAGWAPTAYYLIR